MTPGGVDALGATGGGCRGRGGRCSTARTRWNEGKEDGEEQPDQATMHASLVVSGEMAGLPPASDGS